MSKRTLMLARVLLFISIGSGVPSRPVLAWGDEGHKIIALIAERFLNPAVRSDVSALLAADPDDLTTHDIASEATWADRYRDSDRLGAKVRYEATRRWHFVDIELRAPNVDQACFAHPQL